MNSNKRIFYYDLLRAIAIIFVILIHIDGAIGYGFDSFKHAIPGLLTTIAMPAVAIFIMLTGALLLNKSYTLKEFFKKRFTRIFYPFIFWIAITDIIGYFCFNWSTEQMLNVIFGLVSPSWFLWTLIGIYLFIPIINSFLKEYGLRGLEYFLIVWAVTIFLTTFNIPLLSGLHIVNFSSYAGFAVLGYYIDNKEFGLSDKKMFYIGLLIFIAATLFRMYVFRWEIKLYPNLDLLFTNVAQSIGLFLTVKYMDKKSINVKGIYNKIKRGILGKIILSISVCSYGMYFAHYIIISYFEFNDIGSLKLLPVMLIITVLMTWLLTFIISKIPYLKIFSGAN